MTGLLDGKIALVTGAGHGIGRGHALELAKHGATVIVNDLGTTLAGEGTGKVADEVVAIIEGRGGKAVSDFSDVGDEEQVDLAVERAYSQLEPSVSSLSYASQLLPNMSCAAPAGIARSVRAASSPRRSMEPGSASLNGTNQRRTSA